METLTVTVLILVVLGLGSLVHGLTGFGFALMTMGIMSMFFTVKQSTLIVLALNAVFMIPMLIRYRAHLRFRTTLFIFSAAVIGNLGGYLWLSRFGDVPWMKKALGLVMILLVAVQLFQKYGLSVGKTGDLGKPLPVFAIGMAGGFMGAVFAVGGPFFVTYFLAKYPDKREYNVNLQLLFILLILQTILLHFFGGGFDRTFYTYLLLGLPVVLLGVYVGMHYFDRFHRAWIERLAFVIILVSGVQLLL